MNEFKDRALTIIGVGAFLTVLCLLFKWPFVARIVVGLIVLVVSMVIAVMRLGDDNLPIEQYLARRLSWSSKPRKFSYSIDQKQPKAHTEPARSETLLQPISLPASSTIAPPAHMMIIGQPLEEAPQEASRKLAPAAGTAISLGWEEVGIYRLVTIWLLVIGIYFVYWLSQGGTEQIGQWMKTILHTP